MATLDTQHMEKSEPIFLILPRARAEMRAKLTNNALWIINKEAIFRDLENARITHVIINFNGYCNSGQIEQLEFWSGDKKIEPPEVMLPYLERQQDGIEAMPKQVSLCGAVENLVYDRLALTHCGWEEGEGASGDIRFDVATKTIQLDLYRRYSDVEHFAHVF